MTEIRVDQYIYQRRPTRYRFSLAHELAHVLIHQDIFKALKFSTIADWKIAMTTIPEEQYSLIEWQAYCLGGLILVPERPLKDLFETKSEEAKRAGLNLQDADDEMRRVVESHIGRYFEVSAGVIARRMKYDKLWS